MEPSADEIAEQARRYTEAVGSGLPNDVVAELADFTRDAGPNQVYADHQEVRFWYEFLYKDGWSDRVGKLADLWVQVGLPLSGFTMATDRARTRAICNGQPHMCNAQ